MSAGRDRLLPSGLLVRPALVHDGAARRLVHRLKYQAFPAAARVLAEAMLPRLTAEAVALVPVPRVVFRRARYGVDAGVELARALGALSGLAVLQLLKPPLWEGAHAGRTRAQRNPPAFRPIGIAPIGSVLVDDVLTTGATLTAAREALAGRPNSSVTATASGVYSWGMPVEGRGERICR